MALIRQRRRFKRPPGAATERARPRPVNAAVLAVLLAWSSGVPAQSAPQPPCGRPPQPYYAQKDRHFTGVPTDGAPPLAR